MNNLFLGFYSISYVLFFCMLFFACFVLVSGRSAEKIDSHNIEVFLYWSFSFLLIIFVFCRPFGIARDDIAYLEIFEKLCPIHLCGDLMQSKRDWGWYAIVGILKSLFSDPRTMLFISLIATLIKLVVIYRLSRSPLLALLLFVGVFYQIQDITAFRVSFSLAIYMLALEIWLRGSERLGKTLLLVPGFFHFQAYLTASIILIKPLFMMRYRTIFIGIVAPFILLHLFGKPGLVEFLSSVHREIIVYASWLDLDSYLVNSIGTNVNSEKLVPVVFYPLTLLGLCLAFSVFHRARNLYAVCVSSMALASWLMLLFASMPAAQARFYEFFMLPIVLLAGNAKKNNINLFLIGTVSLVWVIRHNILNQILV